MNKNVLFAFVAMVSLVACSSNGTPGSWKEHNLLRYDLPISIMGPDSVIVISDNLLFAKDVTIEGALEKGSVCRYFHLKPVVRILKRSKQKNWAHQNSTSTSMSSFKMMKQGSFTLLK